MSSKETASSTPRRRPLSPHLTIYRPQITSMLSIMHRGTGVLLYYGAVAFVVWLAALAHGEESFLMVQGWIAHPVGKLVMGVWSFCLYYHLCNGIRHLFWDAGKGFSLPAVTFSGVLVLLVSLGATAASWFFLCDWWKDLV